jgi:ketosteroid isomerase-like protein
MRLEAWYTSLVVGAFAVAATAAQPPSGDEAAIRAAIGELQRSDLRTADSIFFSGGLKRPFVRGQSEPEPTTRARTVVPGSDRTETRVRRIEIAQAGDLAYEFSDGTGTRRMKRPDGSEEPATFENSTLRVWKKVDGRWLVAAHFAAPHGDRQ